MLRLHGVWGLSSVAYMSTQEVRECWEPTSRTTQEREQRGTGVLASPVALGRLKNRGGASVAMQEQEQEQRRASAASFPLFRPCLLPSLRPCGTPQVKAAIMQQLPWGSMAALLEDSEPEVRVRGGGGGRGFARQARPGAVGRLGGGGQGGDRHRRCWGLCRCPVQPAD